MFNTLAGKFGGFAGGSSNYLGTKILTANTTITFPNGVGFAVVKLFGGRGNNGQGGYTSLKLGSSSAGQTYYVTTDGSESPGGTWVNNGGPGAGPGGTHVRSRRGGGFVALSTATMGPGGGSIPTKVGVILGISGGSGSGQPQSGTGAGSGGYPAGGNGGAFSGTTAPGGRGGNNTTPSPVVTPSAGSALTGVMGTTSPPPNSGSGGGGGAGYIGGNKGTATSTSGGRGGGGGGGSNYYVPSSNPHLSSVANSVFSKSSGYDTTDIDYDVTLGRVTAPDSPDTGSTGYAVIRFFTGDEPNYDDFDSSQPTAPNGF